MVTDWRRRRSNDSNPANDSETVWVTCNDEDILEQGFYADDFLQFSNKSDAQLKKRFDIKTGPVDVHLGNQISAELDKYISCYKKSDTIN